MSDSEFVVALRKDRAELLPALEAAGLPAAREAQGVAREEYRAVVEPRERIRGSATQREHELNAAATAANQAVADLELSQERAQERIAQIDRLLTASADAGRARKELTKANAGVAEARARIAQLGQIATDLEREIGELTQRRIDAIAQHGREDLAQRLAGKVAPPPKGLSALDADLESRRAALAATQSAKTEAAVPLPTLIEEAEGARTRLRGALQRAAELAYYELLPTVLPVVGRLVALGSPICGYSSLEIHVDDETLQGAHDALREEIGVS